jgi:hypothetical protein
VSAAQITSGCIVSQEHGRVLLTSSENNDLFPGVLFAAKLSMAGKPSCPQNFKDIWVTMQYHEPSGGPASSNNPYWVGSVSHRYQGKDSQVANYDYHVGLIVQEGYYALPSNEFLLYGDDGLARFETDQTVYATFDMEGPFSLSNNHQVLRIETGSPCLGTLTLGRVNG